jgi:hypothetical protein
MDEISKRRKPKYSSNCLLIDRKIDIGDLHQA